MQVVNNFNCRGFGPLLEDKLCLIFKLAPSVCRMTFPILASLLVRLVVLLPFQLLRLSLATPSRWTPLALSVFLHCVVALLLTLLDNQKEIAEMQNETQKEIAGIQSATSRQNTKDQVYAQNEMLAYQQKESTARVASIMENTNLSKQQ